MFHGYGHSQPRDSHPSIFSCTDSLSKPQTTYSKSIPTRHYNLKDCMKCVYFKRDSFKFSETPHARALGSSHVYGLSDGVFSVAT